MWSHLSTFAKLFYMWWHYKCWLTETVVAPGASNKILVSAHQPLGKIRTTAHLLSERVSKLHQICTNVTLACALVDSLCSSQHKLLCYFSHQIWNLHWGQTADLMAHRHSWLTWQCGSRTFFFNIESHLSLSQALISSALISRLTELQIVTNEMSQWLW